MKNEPRKSKITDLMSLLVFCIFAVCVLAVLLTGADVYKGLVDRGAEDYHRRTAAQYVTTRIHQADAAGSVAVEDFGGHSALVLREEINGKTYLTRVYCYDGFLRELFTAESGSFSPEDGEKLLKAEQLFLFLDGDLLYAEITLSDGATQALSLHLRSAEEAKP